MTASMPEPSLDAIRHEIDSIDGQILKLLTQRFQATEKVRATKAQDGSIAASPFRPAREAAMMRRLISEAGAGLPPELLVRLWRVILSASIQSQAPVTLHMDAALGQDLATRLLVNQHFCAMAVELHDSPGRALDRLRTARGDLALVAPSSEWAAAQQAAADTARVIGTLPILATGSTPQLLVFGHAEPQPSGDDETLLLITTDVPQLSEANWQARCGTATLAAFPGFLDEGSPQITELLLRHPGVRVAGRYPRPIKLSTKVSP